MYQGVLIAGFGGQGVVSAGILLTYAGMLEKKHVTFFPSYGAEMRGGTANCSVVVSTEEVASPVVTFPDTLIVMNEPSLTFFEPQLKSGGLLILNSSLVNSKPTRSDVTILSIPANNIAEKAGTLKSANMVALGAFCQKTGAVSIDAVIKALPKVYSKLKEEALQKNIAALKMGAEAVIGDR